MSDSNQIHSLTSERSSSSNTQELPVNPMASIIKSFQSVQPTIGNNISINPTLIFQVRPNVQETVVNTNFSSPGTSQGSIFEYYSYSDVFKYETNSSYSHGISSGSIHEKSNEESNAFINAPSYGISNQEPFDLANENLDSEEFYRNSTSNVECFLDERMSTANQQMNQQSVMLTTSQPMNQHPVMITAIDPLRHNFDEPNLSDNYHSMLGIINGCAEPIELLKEDGNYRAVRLENLNQPILDLKSLDGIQIVPMDGKHKYDTAKISLKPCLLDNLKTISLQYFTHYENKIKIDSVEKKKIFDSFFKNFDKDDGDRKEIIESIEDRKVALIFIKMIHDVLPAIDYFKSVDGLESPCENFKKIFNEHAIMKSKQTTEKSYRMYDTINRGYFSYIMNLHQDVTIFIEVIIILICNKLRIRINGERLAKKANTIGEDLQQYKTWNKQPQEIKIRAYSVVKRVFWSFFKFDIPIIEFIFRKIGCAFAQNIKKWENKLREDGELHDYGVMGFEPPDLEDLNMIFRINRSSRWRFPPPVVRRTIENGGGSRGECGSGRGGGRRRKRGRGGKRV